jgi:D-sedoheptulose 7-phosphate isomerase
MNYPEQYRVELLNAIQGLDLDRVNEIIDFLCEARALGRRVFVCGSGKNAAAAAELLCEMIKGSSVNRSTRFRIVALSEEPPATGRLASGMDPDRILVNQLKDAIEPGDVIIGISAPGNSAAILRAFEFGIRIGCRTISITGRDGGKLANVSDIAVLVPASHEGSVEDAHMIICHMIAHYFLNRD